MRKISIIIAIIMLTVFIPVNSWATDPVKVVVDGKEIQFSDAPAYIDSSGRTQVPSRFIGEALGADVGWDEKTRKVTFYRSSSDLEYKKIYLEFQIGSSAYYVGSDKGKRDESRNMDTQAMIENSRTYIPVRYVAEALGAKVDWDAGTRTVTITSGQRIVSGFIIPDSFTELVYDTDDGKAKAVFFDINFLSNLEVRLEKALEVVAQRIGTESISRIRTWVLANREYEAKHGKDHLKETFLDPISGQYVCIVRLAAGVKTDGDFRIIIYNRGDTPSR